MKKFAHQAGTAKLVPAPRVTRSRSIPARRRIFAILAAGVMSVGAFAEQPNNLIATITPPGNPSSKYATASLTLLGSSLTGVIAAPRTARSSVAAIHGPAGSGASAPIIFDLGGPTSCDLPGPSDPGGCEWEFSFLITQEQINELLAGRWYITLNDTYRGQIFYTGNCHFSETNSIWLESAIEGERPTGPGHPQIRWGRANFGLTETNLSIEILLPAAYQPYHALVYGLFDFDLGVLDCVPLTNTNPRPDASGLELLPQCRARLAICLPPSVASGLLAGQYSIGVFTDGVIFGAIRPVDTDRDGVPDYRDHCPNTAPGSLVNADGCSLEDLCPCNGPWKNHAEYLKCFKGVADDFKRAGLITEAQRKALLKAAEHSDCGKKPPHPTSRPLKHPHGDVPVQMR